MGILLFYKVTKLNGVSLCFCGSVQLVAYRVWDVWAYRSIWQFALMGWGHMVSGGPGTMSLHGNRSALFSMCRRPKENFHAAMRAVSFGCFFGDEHG